MSELSDTEGTDLSAPESPSEGPDVPRPKAPPIESRFLFVDVAAMRAKQLRRGARVRLDEGGQAADSPRPVPRKAERLAMEEVRRGLVLYEVPGSEQPPTDAA